MKLLIIIFSFLINFHPLHLTVTNIDYNSKEKSHTISIKIFTDDLQTVVFNKYGKKVPIDASLWTKEELKAVNNYVLFKFQLKPCSTDNLIFKSKKCNFESVTLKYELKCSKSNLIIRNTILHELYGDQKNLIIFKSQNQEKAYELKKGKEEVQIKL